MSRRANNSIRLKGKVDSGIRRNTCSPDLAHLGSTVPGLGGRLPANPAYPCVRRKYLVPEPRQGEPHWEGSPLDSAKRIQARAKAGSQCNCHHHHQILGLRLHSLPASRAAPAVLSPGPFPRRQASQRKPRNLELAVAAFNVGVMEYASTPSASALPLYCVNFSATQQSTVGQLALAPANSKSPTRRPVDHRAVLGVLPSTVHL